MKATSPSGISPSKKSGGRKSVFTVGSDLRHCCRYSMKSGSAMRKPGGRVADKHMPQSEAISHFSFLAARKAARDNMRNVDSV